MKKSLFSGICFLGKTFLLFSCTSEEKSLEIPGEKSGISFGAILKGMRVHGGRKQGAVDILQCVTTVPAFADLILTPNEVPMAGTFDEPLRMRVYFFTFFEILFFKYVGFLALDFIF